MSAKTKPHEIYLNIEGIKIKVEETCKTGVYVRLYYTDGEEEREMFPDQPSIFLSEKEPLSIMANEGFKMIQKLIIS